MICRIVLLELHGGTHELRLEGRALRSRRADLTWDRFELGGLRLEDDGWHLLGLGGELGPNAYASASSALEALLDGRRHELTRRLAP